ncbi:MAG: phosphoribosyltransferase [Gammaproteobacteria bacterium]|nr:phosphoribosyltransferase [Gammaproteobacteria bacterium]
MFKNRQAAAEQLAEALSDLKGQNPLILAIPRGAVPMGALLAERLEGELDVVLVRKFAAPGQPEFAIGAIDEQGRVYLAPHAARLGISDSHLQEQQRQQLALIRSRRLRYTPNRPPISVTGRTVVVLDDGIATGSTMLAALQTLRAQHPRALIAATPVAAPDSVERIKLATDRFCCLLTPPEFQAVGQFYRDFPQIGDYEVIALLNPAAANA